MTRENGPSPAAISPLELRDYVSALNDAGYAKASIARKLASLRSFFRFAQREGLVDQNPAKPLRNPRPGRHLPHFLTTDEIQRLLAAPDVPLVPGLSRPGDPGDDVFGRSAGQRDGGHERRGRGSAGRDRAGSRQGTPRAIGPAGLVRRQGPAALVRSSANWPRRPTRVRLRPSLSTNSVAG